MHHRETWIAPELFRWNLAVREMKLEWSEGHLENATLVTVTEEGFIDEAKAVLAVKKPVMVYCRSGKRSAIATEQLRASGFIGYDFAGGITAWSAAGKEVVKG